MPLLIGSTTALANVQNPALISSLSSVIQFTLPLPSTTGTLLLALLSNVFGTTITAAPMGWVNLGSADQAGVAHIEVWAFPNNPGGLSVFNFTQSTAQSFEAHVSEWAGLSATGVLDSTVGVATATSGTTLAPATGGNLTISGDLAISAWIQKVAPSQLVTFTTPPGFTRLCANPANQIEHMDAEYEINPAIGTPLVPTLTSTGTTTSAAGVVIVLTAAPPVGDQTAYIQNNSMVLKRNTADFALIDYSK